MKRRTTVIALSLMALWSAVPSAAQAPQGAPCPHVNEIDSSPGNPSDQAFAFRVVSPQEITRRKMTLLPTRADTPLKVYSTWQCLDRTHVSPDGTPTQWESCAPVLVWCPNADQQGCITTY